MNVVDSSAWVEYFAGGENAFEFAAAIEDTDQLIVPSLAIYEVFKRVSQLQGEGAAMQAIAAMLGGKVADLTASVALEAARISLRERLSPADSIILATARLESATLWTQDAHFDGLDSVEYRTKA